MDNRLRIPIETSARHIHLSRTDFEKFFGPGAELTPVKELSQPGQFLARERLNIIGPRGTFENVAVVGPFRKESQIELALTDVRKLGIPGVIRQSGDIEGTPGCILACGDKKVEICRGVIVAKRHIHMSPRDAIRFQVRGNENVFVIAKSYERYLIYADVVVRVHRDYKLAMHVDTDEANAVACETEPYGVIVKLFEYGVFNMERWMQELEQGIYRTR